MKTAKILKPLLIIALIISIPFIGIGISRQYDFNFLSEQFVTIFDDVNEQLDGKFSYRFAEYENENMPEYFLDYSGNEENFTADSISFYNNFFSCVNSGNYEAFRLEDYHIVRIYLGKKYILFSRSYSKTTCTVTTNVPCDFSEFEAVSDIKNLEIVTLNFTNEQKEYAVDCKEKFSFDISLFRGIPSNRK